MPSATLLYTAELLHPSNPERTLLELEVSAELDWAFEQEGWFFVNDIYIIDDKYRNGIRLRSHVPLPLFLKEWVKSRIEADRKRIAKAISESPDEDEVVVERTGGRLVLPDPF
jgi:hypothetical protein